MAKKDGLAELIAIMRDDGAKERDRLNSAISASRVEPLVQPGQEPPPAVLWLRRMVDDYSAPTGYRREAASALAYWERRAKKNALQFNVIDTDAKRQEWRRILNGLLRRHLWAHGRWPADKRALYIEGDEFETPPYDPELALSALLLGGNRQERRRRQRAIDQPREVFVASDEQRLEILRSIAHAMHVRLAEFEADRVV